MPTRKTPSWLVFPLFWVVWMVASFSLYLWLKGPTIGADEVRVYRQYPSGKSTLQPLVHLRGGAAQNAANNFRLSSDGTYYECLDAGGWFRVVFLCKNQPVQSFELYLRNGQMNREDQGKEKVLHLSESSRLYWEKLVQRGH